MEVHHCIEALELHILAMPAPPVDVSTFLAAVESLGADLDMILEARVPEFEAPSTEPAKDTLLVALFSTVAVPPPPPRERAKRRRC